MIDTLVGTIDELAAEIRKLTKNGKISRVKKPLRSYLDRIEALYASL